MLLQNPTIFVEELGAPPQSRRVMLVFFLYEPEYDFEVHPSAMTVQRIGANFEVVFHIDVVFGLELVFVQEALERSEHNLLHIFIWTFFLAVITAFNQRTRAILSDLFLR